jgi:hypothetical protein
MEPAQLRPNPTDLSPRSPRRLVVIGIIIVTILLLVGLTWYFVVWQKQNVQKSTDNGKSSVQKNVIVQSEPPTVDPFPNDKDRDGLSDEQEKKAGTSDFEFDTDHDGLSDKDEINVWHTNPTKSDTDGDKFSDGYEVANGYNPNGSGKIIKK